MICDEMTSAWSAVFDVAFKPVRVATRPKQIAIYEPQELMVDTLFEFDVSGVEGKMHMMIPAASMRPVEKKLASGLLDSGASDGRSWSRQLTQLLCDVTVLCTAELGRASVTVRQLMDLKVGDILRLDRDPDSPITIFVEGLPRLQGTPTLEHGNIAIEVATVIEQSKPKEQTYKPPTPEMAPQAQENEDG
jgi:flagellar motor switch protein FliM